MTQLVAAQEKAQADRKPVPLRGDIQGLRAVAVLLVVAYHLWPNRLSGGYIGVDVFLVISGYLISAHLVREYERTGTIALRRFWSRRVRRLLPAALMVLGVGLVSVVAFMPDTVWAQNAREVAAGTLYVENWVLAFNSVDYLAADNAATIAQHYWSLSVEEQFYLLWPLLIVGIAFLSRASKNRAQFSRMALTVVISAVTVVSLVASVMLTAQEQSSAYFFTHTRLWEFGFGAILAIVGTSRWSKLPISVLLAWLGLGVILVAAFMLDGESEFPGYIALLPVVGATAIIAAGDRQSRVSVDRVLGQRIARFMGDISYSVYLWHWPLIVVVPAMLGHSLGTIDKLLIIVVTVGLAWATKRFVEDPARRSTWLAKPSRSFLLAGLVMLALVAASQIVQAEVNHRTKAAAQSASALSGTECYGPQVLDVGSGCEPIGGERALTPPPGAVAQQNVEATYPGCQASIKGADLVTCVLGAQGDDVAKRVAIIGDSHATHWFPAFDVLGKENNWQVTTYSKASCPFSVALRVLDNEQTDDAQMACATWVEDVTQRLIADPEISAVFTSSYSSAYKFASPTSTVLVDPRIDGFQGAWGPLVAAGKQVVVLGDVPRTVGERIPNCLSDHPNDRAACNTSREAALVDRYQLEAARGFAHPAVASIDLSHHFCDDSTCYAVLGDMIVYRDSSHISAEFTRSLAPYIDDAYATIELNSNHTTDD